MRALAVDFISLAVLSISIIIDSPASLGWLFVLAFIVQTTSLIVLIFNMDIFLEHFSQNNKTGSIRGLFLTAFNSSFIIGPFIAGLLITDTFDAGKVYLFNAIILIPVAIITRKYLRKFEDREYTRGEARKTISKVWKDRDLSRIFTSDLFLRIFYSWMVIYTPIHLHDIGFTLSDIALIMSFALIPFLLLQIPLGRIADKWLGEKEILTLGFMIAGLATMSMTFFDSHSFWFWAIILFVTRIGASMIEVMNETYLFKKINDSDVGILSVFRSMRPLAYIVGPALASLLLIGMGISGLFFILGLILLSGMVFSMGLKDTL